MVYKWALVQKRLSTTASASHTWESGVRNRQGLCPTTPRRTSLSPVSHQSASLAVPHCSAEQWGQEPNVRLREAFPSLVLHQLACSCLPPLLSQAARASRKGSAWLPAPSSQREGAVQLSPCLLLTRNSDTRSRQKAADGSCSPPLPSPPMYPKGSSSYSPHLLQTGNCNLRKAREPSLPPPQLYPFWSPRVVQLGESM